MSFHAPAATTRTAYIDHLRVFLTALVIFHHTAITYGGSGGWYWRDQPEGSNLLLIIFNAFNQSYFMGFFFLLAGYYTPDSYARKGGWRFLGDRLLRLGVPLAVYFFVLSPLTIALAQTADGYALLPRWGELMRLGIFEPGPLWFAEALLLFALAFAVWRWVRPAAPSGPEALPRFGVLAAAAAAIGVINFLVRLKIPVGTNIAWLQVGYFPAYIFLFAAGCLAARHRLLDRVGWPQARPWVGVSAAMVVVLGVVMKTRIHAGSFQGGWTLNAAIYAFWDPFVAWGVILALLWWFRAQGPAGNRLTAWCARCAYGAFILHPPVLVAVSLLFRAWALAPLGKFLVVGSLACVGSALAASLLLLIPGARRIL